MTRGDSAGARQLRKSEPTGQTRQALELLRLKTLFVFLCKGETTREVGGGARQLRKAEPTGQTRQALELLRLKTLFVF
ncbi:hypothetical protein [Bacillus sp. SM2101]|uniref:hypothetical protein n=1 Tax=Bacillus sp. SM2101 TaxID=2805366 RepID=UPI001BDF0E5A|nr:hypothetical protein [Bacillus sp. SM2101]